MPTNHKTAKEILKQLMKEADARMEYEHFLHECPDLEEEDVKAVQEIEADEANHMLILQAMLKKYDGCISATADGAQKALECIADGIEEETAIKVNLVGGKS